MNSQRVPCVKTEIRYLTPPTCGNPSSFFVSSDLFGSKSVVKPQEDKKDKKDKDKDKDKKDKKDKEDTSKTARASCRDHLLAQDLTPRFFCPMQDHGIYNDFMDFYSDSMGYQWDIPSGKLTLCYGKIHHFQWVNPL